MERKNNYDAIDFAKFVGSILVISIHSNALNGISPLAGLFVCGGIARLAVPFFFTCSAFFFFKKGTEKEITKTYCKRILTLYLSWFVVTLPITVFERFFLSETPFLKSLLSFVQSAFLSSTFSGSWFLTSCVFCAWLFFFVEKRKIPRAVVLIVCAAEYLFCCLSSAYGNLIPKLGLSGAYEAYRTIFLNPYTSIIVGVSYFALGKHFAECEKKERFLLSVKSTRVCLSVSLLLFLGEIYLCGKLSLSRTTDCYLTLFPCAAFLFSLAVRSKAKIKHALLFRKISTVFFFAHFIWLFCFRVFERLSKIPIAAHFKFLGALALCVLTAEIFFALEKTKRFAWIKNFY